MKNYLVLGLAVCSAIALTSCKSRESAYRQAYEKAKAQEQANPTDETTTVRVTTTTPPATTDQQTVSVTPVTSVSSSKATTDNSDVRTIQGGVTLIGGDPLKAYSVVVGSFVTQANAEDLMKRLSQKGYSSRVVKTNETINNHTGWFRVIASSFDDKASAAQSRTELSATYPGSWLLYNK